MAKGIMGDNLKAAIAKDLGVADKVYSGGWGNVSSKDCGNMVKRAIEMANGNTTTKNY